MPKDFVIVDLETTGLDTYFDEIIEIGAVKVKNLEIIDTYQSFVKPEQEISSFITDLTGITNELVANAPKIDTVLPSFFNFTGNNLIVGHNVNFDINFIYDVSNGNFTNDYIDTLRLSRKILPDLKHHRLKDLIKEFNIIPKNQHRAMDDCITTFEVYKNLCKLSDGAYDNIQKIKKSSNYIDLRTIIATDNDFNFDNPFYNKICVFTGVLEKFSRQEAAQLIVNLGGICANGVTKKTNYLILGNNDYCASIKDGKSSKHKKAEEYKLKGQDIEIITENVFYDMLDF